MRTERMEVRLDPDTRSKLEEVAGARGVTVSEAVRGMIEASYDSEVAGAARLEAARRIGARKIEDTPSPKEMKRQFSEAHGSD